MEHILQVIAAWITAQISVLGYAGVAFLMAIESACIPLPSEVIMPFSGYLTIHSQANPNPMSLFGVAVAGALGCVIGSVASYCVGLYGGRPFIERYGKYVLIRQKDLDTADRWFAKYGNAAVFISRLLPVVRTFISFPAGIARVRFSTFVAYTFLGSLPWCLVLAYVGRVLGKNWTSLRGYFHNADVVIGVLVIAGIALFIYHHVKPEKKKISE
ncbi:MAG: DedA family protein [Armatimonadota bacterium]